MLELKDYRAALEAVAAIVPDFVSSAIGIEDDPIAKKEYDNKAAYILAMSDAIKSLNSMRHNVLITNKPVPRLPNNNNFHKPTYNPRYPNRFDGDDRY